MKKNLCFSLLFVFLLFSACQKDELIIPEGEYSLEEGFTLSFNDGEYSIHFDEVIYDFRGLFNDNPLDNFKYRLISSKGGLEEEARELPRPGNSRPLFYTPVGIYRFQLIKITPSIDEMRAGSVEPYTIYFTLTEA